MKDIENNNNASIAVAVAIAVMLRTPVVVPAADVTGSPPPAVASELLSTLMVGLSVMPLLTVASDVDVGADTGMLGTTTVGDSVSEEVVVAMSQGVKSS